MTFQDEIVICIEKYIYLGWKNLQKIMKIMEIVKKIGPIFF